MVVVVLKCSWLVFVCGKKERECDWFKAAPIGRVGDGYSRETTNKQNKPESKEGFERKVVCMCVWAPLDWSRPCYKFMLLINGLVCL